MSITVEATYEDGTLKLDEPLPLKERQRVEIVIRTPLDLPSTGPGASVEEREEALRRLFSLQLPVADWDEMEQEIIRGAVE